MRVAFLGLGIMGHAMATNLVKAGHEVTVWNRTPGKMVEGAGIAPTPAAAAQGAEVVWLCVADTAAVGSVNPNFGFFILLGLFTAAVLGGIGSAYGALAGGIVIGLAQEWSTLFFNTRWKPVVGFAILIVMLLVMPRGIFGGGRARS